MRFSRLRHKAAEQPGAMSTSLGNELQRKQRKTKSKLQVLRDEVKKKPGLLNDALAGMRELLSTGDVANDAKQFRPFLSEAFAFADTVHTVIRDHRVWIHVLQSRTLLVVLLSWPVNVF